MDKKKLMLSFMRELNDGNVPTYLDYNVDKKTFYDVIEACQDEGLIKDARIKKNNSSKEILIVILDNAKLTVKGVEYLKENSTLMKTYKGLKEIREWLP